MGKLKWLLEVADKKPLLFSIILLLIAIGVLADATIDRDKKYNKCVEDSNKIQERIQEYYEYKIDSIRFYYQKREIDLNSEVKDKLNAIIVDYKDQLIEQKALNTKVTKTISKNDQIIKRIY